MSIYSALMKRLIRAFSNWLFDTESEMTCSNSITQKTLFCTVAISVTDTEIKWRPINSRTLAAVFQTFAAHSCACID